ncbi:MAG TPA: flavin reductase [Bacteroidales bacterium]|nr:flavin reductase [Bacteroidales bacterium]
MKKIFIIVMWIVMLQNAQAQSQTDAVPADNIEGFTNTGWQSLNDNVIKMVGTDWMLITAGNIGNYNMMTASWGGLGWLWEKPVAFIFVRPQRYTHEFTEQEKYFTLTFFEETYRKILLKMGSVSGRDYDKIKNSGLTPLSTTYGSVAFREAKIIIECKKIYAADLQQEQFTDKELAKKIYPSSDFHTMYVGEIVNVWKK